MTTSYILSDAATPLKPDLHPPSAGAVVCIGVAPTISRDNVRIVILSGARYKSCIEIFKKVFKKFTCLKPDATVVRDHLHPRGNDCSL